MKKLILLSISLALVSAVISLSAPPASASAVNWQWAKRLGGTGGDTGYGVTVDSNDNIITISAVTGNADVNGDGDSSDGGAESGTGYGGQDILISVFSSSGTWQWAKRLGGSGTDSGYGVTVDSNNNIIVTGYVTGNIDVNGDGDSTDGGAESATGYGGTDPLISVFNSSGTWQWAKRFGGTSTDYGWAVATDSNDNVVASIAVTGDVDVNGDGDNTDGGAESGTGYGGRDIVISVFNSSGTWQWAKRLGGSAGNDNGYAITVDSQNNVIVTGIVVGNVDMNGDGDSTDGGAESGTGYGSYDILISVFNSSGTWQWAKRLGGAGSDWGEGITADNNNNITVTGYVPGDVDVNGDGDSTDGGAESAVGYGGNDIIISVFNSAGTWQWAKRLGGTTGSDTVAGITADTANNIIVTGFVYPDADVNGDGDSTDGGAESPGYGGADILISAFNSSGTWKWAMRLGGTGYDNGRSVAFDSNNNIIVTGWFTGDGDVNGDGDSTDGGAESSFGYGGQDIILSVFNFDEIAPSISLTALTPDPNSDSTPSLTGTATDASGTISAVEFQVDSTAGSWTACIADDGAFDSASESFTCTATAQSVGTRTIYVRATDSNTNITLSGSESSDSFEIGEFSLDLAPSGVSESNDSDTAVLGAKTVTSADEVSVNWDRPDDTSNIHEYVVHYREIGSSTWKTESAGPDADSISWDPGEGNWEWYLEIVYTDGSTSETSIYKFEVDQSSPENQLISIADEQMISLTDEQNNGLLLPFGSPLIFNFGNTTWDTVIEIWNWDKTIHYTTMVCGSGICDHGDILTGPLTLVIYTVDEAGNESDRREIKVSPFGFVAGYVSNSTVPSEPTGSAPSVTTVNVPAEITAVGGDATQTATRNSPLPANSSQLAPGIVRGAVEIDTSLNPTAINNPGIVSGAVDFPEPKLAPEPPRQNIFQRMWNNIFH